MIRKISAATALLLFSFAINAATPSGGQVSGDEFVWGDESTSNEQNDSNSTQGQEDESQNYQSNQGNQGAEPWKITTEKSCGTITVNLPTPAIDVNCDVDTRTGNVSHWFNPLATCSLDFDMIGLPTIGDIAAGLQRNICGKLNEIKNETIDSVIDEINSQIPDEFQDLWEDKDEQPDPFNPSVPNKDDLCYTKDASGQQVVVPCSITDKRPSNPDTCYIKDDAMSNDWRKIECTRATPDFEMCVVGQKRDNQGRPLFYSDGTPIPELASCGSTPLELRNNACLEQVTNSSKDDDGYRPVSCKPNNETQYNRLCQQTSGTSSELKACISVDTACYGHINGVFQADQCRDHTDHFYRTYGSSQSNDSLRIDSAPQVDSNIVDQNWEW